MRRHVLFAVVFVLLTQGYTKSISVTRSTSGQLELNWHAPQLSLEKENNWTHIWFPESKYSKTIGKPAIPFTEFVLGIPDQGEVIWEITNIEREVIPGINPRPVSATAYQNDSESNKYIVDSIDYNFLPEKLIDIGSKEYFRDLPIRRVQFYPISYNQSAQSLTVIRSATIRFTFTNVQESGFAASRSSKLDRLYPDFVINYDQARKWLRQRERQILRKSAQFDGPWYRFQVTEDGLYKISHSALSAAGINVGIIDPRTIKIWNSGGQPLNPNTTSTENNPLGPQENRIIVFGEEDGQFDQGDYILFYGTGAGGWDYRNNVNDFIFVQHPYARQNYYWLTFGGNSGARMQVVDAPQSGATVSDDFFQERLRFEDELSNLLASGTDWYGFRFSGTSLSANLIQNISATSGSALPAKIRIRFKSGNGITWDDRDFYRYTFNIFLNPSINATPLFSNAILVSDSRFGGGGGGLTLEKSFVSSDYLIRGDNTLSINYNGNREKCISHLDWVEYYYPKPFTAINNFLIYYTNTRGQIVSYRIADFNATDFVVLDITEPTDVKQINTASAPMAGALDFNLDLTDDKPRRIIVSGLNSNNIKNISTIRAVTPSKNLFDESLAADMIIITHPSFESYAEEIRSLRAQGNAPLSTVVVNTSDIYFYFSSSVQDPVAIRNFIRYAYQNWTNPSPSYVLLFGDGHYDYRNITLADTNRVPPFEIFDNKELNSRESDNFFVDVNFNRNNFTSISPDLAIGRLPMESHLDARRMIEKLNTYQNNLSQDGWQTVMTFVGDDDVSGAGVTGEWIHQRQTELLATQNEINKFIKNKVYLSGFNSIPGGFGRVKPEANRAIIDLLNEGTLLINYVGHGSPQEWAHESVLNLTRDLNRIQNQGKLTFWIAATCDFGKYDDPKDPSFSEALVWQEGTGAIGVLSSARLVFSGDNFNFNSRFLRNLFPSGGASRRLGDALLLAAYSGVNDQKYHLFADPSMYLADPRSFVNITTVTPDTLKALGKVTVSAEVSATQFGDVIEDFDGGAFLIVNDARYDSVNTGGPDYYNLIGPRIFKGEISVGQGLLTGSFIVPKSIRYHSKNTGRITIHAWNESFTQQAMGFVNNMLFNGTEQNLADDSGPEIDIYFKDQEGFNQGDIISKNPLLIAEISDESGINLTEEVGHAIEIQIDEERSQNITSFFFYKRDSFAEGKLNYNLENLSPGRHSLTLRAWDNLNNPATKEIEFRISEQTDLALADVVNYPNPFSDKTQFTFQLQGAGTLAEVMIKIYTISGRLVTTLENFPVPQPGFNYFSWDGRDDDGDLLANGVYIYKIVLRDGEKSKEAIEKLVILR